LYPDCTGLAECGYDVVVEYACVEEKCYPYKFKCPYGCSNGVCVKEATPTTTQTATQTSTQTITRTQAETTAYEDAEPKSDFTNQQTQESTQTQYQLGTQTQETTQTQTRTVWDVFIGFLGIDTSKEKGELSDEAITPQMMYETGFYEQSGIVSTPKPEIVSVNTGITYEAILNMLNGCRIAKVTSTDPPQNPFLYGEHTCDELCEYYERQNYWPEMGSLTCIFGFMHEAGPYAWTGHIGCDSPWDGPSNSTLYTEIQCSCCSPPQITTEPTPVQQQTYAYTGY
jgi:hypothetical protein